MQRPAANAEVRAAADVSNRERLPHNISNSRALSPLSTRPQDDLTTRAANVADGTDQSRPSVNQRNSNMDTPLGGKLVLSTCVCCDAR